MRITHLVPTLHPDGPEIGLVDLAAAAGAAGLEMSVIALSATSETSQVSALRRLGVPVTELGVAPWDPRAVQRTARALREHRSQLVHTHLPPADVVGAAAALRARIPAVSSLHRIEETPADRVDRLKRTAKILARQRFMTRTIAISQTQREWYRRLSGTDDSLLLVPNGVLDPGVPSAETRARQRASLEVGDDDVLAVTTAPTVRGQGHDLLLEAVESMPAELPLVLAIGGDGPLRPWLEAWVDRSPDLVDRVRFVHRSHDQAALLAAADLALHAANSGAAPTALLRAMAAGVPAVATRVGGVPEIVTAATGTLVPLDSGRIGDALVTLTLDGERRASLGAAARARYLAEFAAPDWAARLRVVYEAVLSAPPENKSPTRRRSRKTARS